MISTLGAWFADLHRGWKALGVILSIFAAGLTTGGVVGGLSKIPGRVSVLEQHEAAFVVQLDEVRQNIITIRKTNQQALCLTIAERERTDWHRCLE